MSGGESRLLGRWGEALAAEELRRRGLPPGGGRLALPVWRDGPDRGGGAFPLLCGGQAAEGRTARPRRGSLWTGGSRRSCGPRPSSIWRSIPPSSSPGSTWWRSTRPRGWRPGPRRSMSSLTLFDVPLPQSGKWAGPGGRKSGRRGDCPSFLRQTLDRREKNWHNKVLD